MGLPRLPRVPITFQLLNRFRSVPWQTQSIRRGQQVPDRFPRSSPEKVTTSALQRFSASGFCGARLASAGRTGAGPADAKGEARWNTQPWPDRLVPLVRAQKVRRGTVASASGLNALLNSHLGSVRLSSSFIDAISTCDGGGFSSPFRSRRRCAAIALSNSYCPAKSGNSLGYKSRGNSAPVFRAVKLFSTGPRAAAHMADATVAPSQQGLQQTEKVCAVGVAWRTR